MNNVINCKRCNNIFVDYLGKGICPKCREELNEILVEVKKYIREHRTATINEIASVFEVSTRQVIHWVHEEEIELTPDSSIKMYCEKCNTEILSGRICEDCKKKQVRDLAKAFGSSSSGRGSSHSDRNGNKMRFIEYKGRK